MTVQMIRQATFDLPAPSPRTGGLLDVATVRDGLTWIDPNDLAQSWNCVVGDGVSYTCAPATSAKNFHSPVTIDGVRFYAYLGGTCKGPGASEMQEEIRQAFTLRESALVEHQFQVLVLDNGIAVTAGTTAAETLAAVEGEMAVYAGVPTIHLGVGAAAMLASQQALVRSGNGWTTFTGSKVVIGAGYDPDLIAGTGEVVIARSEMVNVNDIDRSTNDQYSLAERLYLAAADCRVVKASAP